MILTLLLVFNTKALRHYIEDHSSPESPLLKKLHQETLEETFLPNMISGHIQGRFLALLSQMIRPKRILEVGTFTGYSALCLAEGLQPGGRLDTIDIDPNKVERIRRYIREANMQDTIFFHHGRAREIIPSLEGDFDLVFIDGDKEGYPHYYDMVIERMPLGGIILGDNCLWKGKVISNRKDVGTVGIKNFNDQVQLDPRVENVLLPIEDGIMIARKIG